jgi:hypothetical protein
MYAALVVIEQRHVVHHIAELRRFAASPPVAANGGVVTEVTAEIAA